MIHRLPSLSKSARVGFLVLEESRRPPSNQKLPWVTRRSLQMRSAAFYRITEQEASNGRRCFSLPCFESPKRPEWVRQLLRNRELSDVDQRETPASSWRRNRKQGSLDLSQPREMCHAASLAPS